jgi:hypothetical protein
MWPREHESSLLHDGMNALVYGRRVTSSFTLVLCKICEHIFSSSLK